MDPGAFVGTNPTDESITSGLLVIRSQRATGVGNISEMPTTQLVQRLQ